MKKDCFSYFDELCSISKRFADCLTSDKCNNKSELFKRSCALRDECANYALRQFIPPIDRTDIVSICFSLHRMNKALYELILLKEGCSDAIHTNNFFEPLCKTCTEISNIFKTGLPKKLSSLPKTDLILPAFSHYSGRYNPYEMTVMQSLYDKTTECLNTANKVIERVAVAVINNT